MKQSLDIQDFSIVLAARNHNPTIVTLDFLVGSGVIPGEWELAPPPVLSSQASQITGAEQEAFSVFPNVASVS